MPAKGKVNVKWQIIFSIISPLNLWAFYRIKKLQKYLIFVLIPSSVISMSLLLIGYYEMIVIDEYGNQMPTDELELPSYMTPINPQVGKFDIIPYNIIAIVASVGFTVFSVYLIIKWSRQWNEFFP